MTGIRDAQLYDDETGGNPVAEFFRPRHLIKPRPARIEIYQECHEILTHLIGELYL